MPTLNLNVLITLFAWGVWGIFDKKALATSSHVGVMIRLYVMTLWELPLMLVLASILQPGWHISVACWYWTAWAAFATTISFASYLVALSLSDASMVLAVTAAYPVVTQWLAVAFLHEAFVPFRVAGVVAITLGVATIGFSRGKHKEPIPRNRLLVLAVSIVLATVGWGIWGLLDKKALEFATPFESWIAECAWELAILVVALAVAYARGFRPELSDKSSWWFAFLSSVSLAAGKMAFLSALRVSSASYVIGITGCYPLLMYVLAIAFLKERFSKLRLTGILLVVVGGTAVQLTQSL